MPLTLYVDGERWRAHLRRVAAAHPSIVPVAKGNGYGFGVGRLARRAAWLGSDLLAVGTYDEVEQVARRFDGDVLVMSAWRPGLPGVAYDRRLVHTVGRVRDLSQPSGRDDGPRIVVECLTSMRRHGIPADELGDVAARLAGVRLEGVALHLPMAGDRVGETERLLAAVHAAGLPTRRVFVSHLTDAELAEVAGRHPDLELRPRIGTALWLGDLAALSARATVLDAHPVRRGDRVGYRQRRVVRDGTMLVVAGGTAHGIGLEAPTAATSLRRRAVAVARGGLDAAGFALSPFTVAGSKRWFVEPPHMQVSLVLLPAGAAVPQVGTEVEVEVRHTTTLFDRVVVS